MSSLKTEPLVSAIVCVYNAGPYLRAAIDSLVAQTYKNLEILVLDDGSTDGCMSVMKEFTDPRIRVFAQENHGKPATMNRALDEIVRGDFYIIHDADDLSHPRRVEAQLSCMLENPDVAGVFSGHELILDGHHVAPTSRFKDAATCKREIDNFIMPGHDPTAMYRMSLVGDYRYEPTFFLGEGFDYILRVGERYPMMSVGECLYSYRIHLESITKSNPDLREKLVHEVLRRACARRGIDYASRFGHEFGRKRSNRDFDNNLAAHFMDSACDLRRNGNFFASVQTGLNCVWLHPFDFHYHKALVYSLSPRWFIRKVRRNGHGF
jgi:glycosyltransferase involved in cell wall biosynthesis